MARSRRRSNPSPGPRRLSGPARSGGRPATIFKSPHRRRAALTPLTVANIGIRRGKRGSPKASTITIQTPQRLRRQSTLVTPVPALIARVNTPRRKERLLGFQLPTHNRSPKKLELCKCSNTRSDAQRRVSRKFFAHGGGGNRKQIQACQC